jgi:hypothetical protein
MNDTPLFARVEVEQLRARHEEHSPTLKSLPSLGLALICLELRDDGFSMSVLILEPVLRRARVVGAIPVVGGFGLKAGCKSREQVATGHEAATKEILSHPIAFAARIKGIGMVAIAKHMEKEATVGS